MFTLLRAALVAASVAAPAAAAPIFMLNDTGGVGEGTAARAGFEAAAALWAAQFSDDVVIRLDVGFKPLGSGVLAQAGSSKGRLEFAEVRDALARDATSAEDRLSSSLLYARPDLRFMSNEAGNCATGAGCRPLDPDSVTIDRDLTTDNRYLSVNSALWKALGLSSDTLMRDAALTFSSAQRWDFDTANGVRPGYYDFVGVAAHELGHALGFVSGVDTADGRVGRTGLDDVAWGSVLDLFRFEDGLRSWTLGGDPCLSLDRGATCVADFATGVAHGDGRQASHWQDGRGLGIMDPSAHPGEALRITARDRVAFDVMGWDLAAGGGALGSVIWTDSPSIAPSGEWEVEIVPADVPAPGAPALFGLGLAALAARRRRGRARVGPGGRTGGRDDAAMDRSGDCSGARAARSVGMGRRDRRSG